MNAQQLQAITLSAVSSDLVAQAAHYELTSNSLRQEFKQQITELTAR